MKLEQQKSRWIIDRRHVTGAAAGVLVTLLALLGIHAAIPGRDPDAHLVEVVSTAIDRGQVYWGARVAGYAPAAVVLYERSTASGCGRALSETGPFYCPADRRIYLDLAFLRAIDGDLARAYVLAHELGHHVQQLRGELNAGASSVNIELEADCYAGAWMREEQRIGELVTGDIPAALTEAAAVGDDRLCPGCSPEQWTHGSAAARVEAVSKGVAGGGCAL